MVNDSTTHLLVDDSENYSHCTITKKIVQAAVRRHIFIISVRWISECLHANTFVDEHPYEILSDSHTTLHFYQNRILKIIINIYLNLFMDLQLNVVNVKVQLIVMN